MFTYKFVGLDRADAETPYYYGSLPVKPEPGHVLSYTTGNRYAVLRIEGEGLVGDAEANQRELAFADIGADKAVPMLWLQKLNRELQPTGRSFSRALVA